MLRVNRQADLAAVIGVFKRVVEQNRYKLLHGGHVSGHVKIGGDALTVALTLRLCAHFKRLCGLPRRVAERKIALIRQRHALVKAREHNEVFHEL